MPFTPLHIGPGMLFKSVLHRWFSLTIFGLTQLLIDLEPAWYMAADNPPLHRFLHTYLGAGCVALFVIATGRPVGEWLLRLWNRQLSEAQARWLAVSPAISRMALISGALIGGFSHVFLDSFMHGDMSPLSPFAEDNALVHLVTISHLYLGCVIAGLLGLGLYAVMKWWVRRIRREPPASA